MLYDMYRLCTVDKTLDIYFAKAINCVNARVATNACLAVKEILGRIIIMSFTKLKHKRVFAWS